MEVSLQHMVEVEGEWGGQQGKAAGADAGGLVAEQGCGGGVHVVGAALAQVSARKVVMGALPAACAALVGPMTAAAVAWIAAGTGAAAGAGAEWPLPR